MPCVVPLFSIFRPIIDWAAKGERGIGPYETGAMESTTFDQLTIKLGHPYLYQHQGKCEHIIIFSDIRLVCVHQNELLCF